jgi:hypothetical protein
VFRDLKQKLELKNIKVQMGINDSDSKSWSIQKMRDNIDKSACVVIFLTEKVSSKQRLSI